MSDTNEPDLSSLYSMMRPKKICLCRAVTEQDLIYAVHNLGCDTMEKIREKTTASTNCGTCSGRVRAILERELEKMGIKTDV